jgi:predicted dithiol-disulfide oxidoreductase (DUF899 family)
MMTLPPIVSEAEWRAARAQLLVTEKQATRALDQLAAERRRLPMVRVDKEYELEGPDGAVSLVDLFEGRRQLVVYSFAFAPGGSPCTGCSSFVDNIGHLAHLHARDTSLALVSRATLAEISRYKLRMGWRVAWYSSFESDFNYDLGVSTDAGETSALNVFLREREEVFRTYVTDGRGVDRLRLDYNLLDLTPFGRQEEWEDSPASLSPPTRPDRALRLRERRRR